MKYWINVISKDHVLAGMEGGFTQATHGKVDPHAVTISGLILNPAYTPGASDGNLSCPFAFVVRVVTPEPLT